MTISAGEPVEGLLFVEYFNDDPVPASFFVLATEEQRAEIEAWIDRNYADEAPYVGWVVPISFESMKRDHMDPIDDEEDDDPAD